MVIQLIIMNCFQKRVLRRYRKILIMLICLSVFVPVSVSFTEEEIEDLIDIFESNSKIIAIIDGNKTFTHDLRLKEKVLWSESKGHLGVFLTNKHFFVISVSSSAWQVLPLRLAESEKGTAFLSPYIALLVTGNRAVGFDDVSNRFIETRLPVNDDLLEVKVEKYIALVVTSSRAFALATDVSAFTEIHFRIQETLDDIKTTSSKVTIRTSDRLLSFGISGSGWSEYRLD